MPDIASIIGQAALRSLPLAGADKVRAVDAEKRTIDIAFSSEAECDRGWYIEILSHDEGACDLSRLKDSAPFLMDHEDEDHRAHIGVVESAEISGDRRGRARVRLSKRSDVDGVLTDIADGIRPHVSVRYMVLEAREIGQRDGKPIVRVDRWLPLELSSVSVPADHSVGVGRSLTNHHKAPIMPDPITTPAATEPAAPAQAAIPAAPKLDPEAIRSAQHNAQAAERQRVKDILAVGEKFAAQDLARQFVDNGKSMDEFRQALLEQVDAKKTAAGVRERSNKEIGLNDKEKKRFSFARALMAMAHPKDAAAQASAEFELDVCRAAADHAGRSPKGLLIPVDVLRAMSTDTTGLAGTNPSTAGVNIETTKLMSSFIDLLRSQSIMAGLGTTLTGLIGNVEIPKQTTEASAVWIGEDGDAGVTAVDFAQVSLSPKTLAGYTEMTRRLLMQSSMDVEALIRRELAYAVAKAIDVATLYGTAADNQPRGVVNQSGINSVTFAAALPTYAELVSMETALAADDADVGNIKWLINPVVRGHAKTTTKFGTGTEAIIWDGQGMAGYNAVVSNRVKKTLAGSPLALTTTDVFLANWNDVLLALWGGLDVMVDPYTHSLKGKLRIVVHQDCDIAVRHPESFVYGRK